MDRTNRPTIPRITPATGPFSDRVEAVLEMTAGLGGTEPYNVFTTLAHHGRALRHTVALGGAFMFAGNIPDRVREIVIIRVARNTRCEYEYAQHLVIGGRAGLVESEFSALIAPGLIGTWNDEERDVIAMSDELCADDCVTDETWARLAARWDERVCIELVLLCGYYRMLAGYLNSCGVQLDAGLTGWS